MTTKTRFAPSPTGFLHVGGARTALYSWLQARANNGEFVLRIEDTDIERSTQAACDAILEGMNWLGLTWDEGPYYQTKRFDRYNEIIAQMLEKGTAYKCYCSRERIDALRESQAANGEAQKYDGCCVICLPVTLMSLLWCVLKIQSVVQWYLMTMFVVVLNFLMTH